MSTELILGIYASVISTLVLFWYIYAYFNDRKSRLSVKLNKSTQYEVYSWGMDRESASEIIDIVVTNKGLSDKFIERPLFRINKKSSNNTDTYAVLTQKEMQTKYPRRLLSGEKIKYTISVQGVMEKMAEAKGATKIRGVVRDTHGKTFTSKWLRMDK